MLFYGIPAWMAMNGKSPGEIAGFAIACGLPWSFKFMETAHALYRSFGFAAIPVYDEVEIPEEFRQYLVFMEIDL